jgi:hypothetical protein
MVPTPDETPRLWFVEPADAAILRPPDPLAPPEAGIPTRARVQVRGEGVEKVTLIQEAPCLVALDQAAEHTVPVQDGHAVFEDLLVCASEEGIDNVWRAQADGAEGDSIVVHGLWPAVEEIACSFDGLAAGDALSATVSGQGFAVEVALHCTGDRLAASSNPLVELAFEGGLPQRAHLSAGQAMVEVHAPQLGETTLTATLVDPPGPSFSLPLIVESDDTCETAFLPAPRDGFIVPENDTDVQTPTVLDVPLSFSSTCLSGQTALFLNGEGLGSWELFNGTGSAVIPLSDGHHVLTGQTTFRGIDGPMAALNLHADATGLLCDVVTPDFSPSNSPSEAALTWEDDADADPANGFQLDVHLQSTLCTSGKAVALGDEVQSEASLLSGDAQVRVPLAAGAHALSVWIENDAGAVGQVRVLNLQVELD